MSFYGIAVRAYRTFVYVNGGGDDRVDVLIDIDRQLHSSGRYVDTSTARDYNEVIDGKLFSDYTIWRLQFTHNKGCLVTSNFVYYDKESGEALDYVDHQRNHDVSICYARLVLLWDLVLNDLPKAVEQNAAFKTCTYNKYLAAQKKDNDDECAICLEEYEKDDVIGTMGACNCKHIYHQHCLKMWLTTSPRCPICTTSAFKLSR
ncbi:hypothetical protein QVD17_22486 [Tagetes erecta]|uniref:RING-type E3 ubiquitin transferase n=1 Tax=Tagetes erecta TaxID=13708 RepID=A0AAD8KCZ9_TARER|nr:hypothetical protein QVD17_22486 [Tagetes erecta]